MGIKLQVRRGLKKDLPVLAPGEFGQCLDTGEVYIGSENGNQLVRTEAGTGDMLKSVYDTDGDGVVDKAESVPWAGVTGKPASMPANGGNADTVDGKHASDFATTAQGAKADAALPKSGGDMTGYLKFGQTNTGLEWYTASGTRYALRPWSPSNVLQITRTTAGGAESGVFNIYDDSAFFDGEAAVADLLKIGGVDSAIEYNANTDWLYAVRGGKIVQYFLANQAEKDIDGSAIKSTYLASIDTSGNTIRAKNKNGTVLYTVTPPYATCSPASPANTFKISHAQIAVNGPQWLQFQPGGETQYFLTIGGADGGWAFFPSGNNLMKLGSANHKWVTVWAGTGVIQTSDRNAKNAITALAETSLQFLNLLKPVSYKMNDGTSGRIHYGFIAQDVEEAMDELGMTGLDFAGLCKDQRQELYQIITEEPLLDETDGDLLGTREVLKDEWLVVCDEKGAPVYDYSLRYDEFVPLAVLGAQEALRRTEALEAENKALKDALAALTTRVAALEKGA